MCTPPLCNKMFVKKFEDEALRWMKEQKDDMCPY